MTPPAFTRNRYAQQTAESFLSALDEQRWRHAAALVHPATAERFAEQQVTLLHLQPRPQSDGGNDTRFFAPALMFHGIDVAAADPVRLVARYLEAMDPRSVVGGLGAPLQVQRRLVGCDAREDDAVRATFRLQLGGGAGSDHALLLAEAPDGWRITDADLTVAGGGHLVLPDLQFAALHAAFARDTDAGA